MYSCVAVDDGDFLPCELVLDLECLYVADLLSQEVEEGEEALYLNVRLCVLLLCR